MENIHYPVLFPKLSETEQGEDLQRGILCSDEFLKHKRPEIAGYFQIEQDAKIQADYLRNSFRMEEYTEFNIGKCGAATVPMRTVLPYGKAII